MQENKTQIYRAFILLGVFSIAMGILESIVVVYLRQLYYPFGFDFPLIMLSPEMVLIEWIRELATICMLLCVGFIVSKNKLQGFFYFLYSFAVWDIFYYVGLKLFLNWPSSFLSWDILFLIPIPWIGPVLAPLICSLTMIFFSVGFILLKSKNHSLKIKSYQWSLIFFSSFLIFYSFIEDYLKILIQNEFFTNFWAFSSNEQLWKELSEFKPIYYNWFLFALGEIVLIGVISQLFIRKKSN